MKAVASAVVVASVVAGAMSQFTINSLNSVVECEPVQFSWTGGQAPWYLSLVPAQQTSAAAIKLFPATNDTTMTWTVDLASGTSFTSVLKDSTGQQALSGEQTVESGMTTSCVNNAVSVTSGASAGAAPTSGSTVNTATAGNVVSQTSSMTGTTASTQGSSTTSSGSTSTPTSVEKTSGAAGIVTSAGAWIAGFVGLAGAALL